MNILCAPLLYVMPEADAYFTFRQLVMKHCPHYMAPRLQGVESGCLLVDKCLETVRTPAAFAGHSVRLFKLTVGSLRCSSTLTCSTTSRAEASRPASTRSRSS